MYIQLSKDGQIVLSAKSDHDPRMCNLDDDLPVVYVGDTSLLPRADKFAFAQMIVAAFESAELHHKLEISGDYKRCVVAHSNLEHSLNVNREWPKQWPKR